MLISVYHLNSMNMNNTESYYLPRWLRSWEQFWFTPADATVLALMATMISFSLTHESEFRRSHYRRLRMIAGSTSALIIVALIPLSLRGVKAPTTSVASRSPSR